MSNSSPIKYPPHAFVQTFNGAIPPDFQGSVQELQAQGTKIHPFDDINAAFASDFPPKVEHSLVLGDFNWTKTALAKFGIPMPTPPDYPKCLSHLLYRRIGQTTLGEMRSIVANLPPGKQVFIKPSTDTKAFSAIIEPKDQMLDCMIDGIPSVMKGNGPDLPVHYAEVVDMLHEYRVYVVQGKVRSICKYKTVEEYKDREIDASVVEDAVQKLAEDDSSDGGRNVSSGCGMDFTLVRFPPEQEGGEAKFVTALVEVNDGYSLGKYPDLAPRDYTDLLVSRWSNLVGGWKSE